MIIHYILVYVSYRDLCKNECAICKVKYQKKLKEHKSLLMEKEGYSYYNTYSVLSLVCVLQFTGKVKRFEITTAVMAI